MPWSDADRQDLGTVLAELLALAADALAYDQALISGEAYLPSQASPEPARMVVTVDGSPWRGVASIDSAGPDDNVYVADQGADGSLTLRFGDGQHGQRPPAGARVIAVYRVGGGRSDSGSDDPGCTR
jgi:hypothetical protein